MIETGTSRSKCKNLLRLGVRPGSRPQLWLSLPSLNDDEVEIGSHKGSANNEKIENCTLLGYEEVYMKAKQRYDFITSDISGKSIENLTTIDKINLVVECLGRQFDISTVELVIPLVLILCRQINDVKVCLSIMWDLMEKPKM